MRLFFFLSFSHSLWLGLVVGGKVSERKERIQYEISDFPFFFFHFGVCTQRIVEIYISQRRSSSRRRRRIRRPFISIAISACTTHAYHLIWAPTCLGSHSSQPYRRFSCPLDTIEKRPKQKKKKVLSSPKCQQTKYKSWE